MAKTLDEILDDAKNRGRGRTTAQMQSAPHGAHYVWVHRGTISYAKDLAKKLGREDLQIVTPDFFEGHRWAGLELKGLVIDHAVHLTDEQGAGFEGARMRIRV